MIEDVSSKNLHEVLPLIRQYQEFYNVANISDKKNDVFFSQFNRNNPLGCQFAFRHSDGAIVGFATVYFSFASTIAAKVAILNDLYTIERQRGKGVANALIEHCKKYAKSNGAVRLQWVTAPDNQPAKKLYDSLETRKSTWDFYVTHV